MGILAINAMNIEGQVGTAAITRAASNLQANVDFATELDRKLQVKTNPTLTSGVSEPERAAGKGSLSKDGNQSRQAAGPSAVALAAIVTTVPVAAQSHSTAGNRPAPNPEQAATVSSDSATSLSPEIASTFAKVSARPADEGGAETSNPRAGTIDEKRVPVQAALQNEVLRQPNLNIGIPSGEATQVSASSLKTEASQDKDSKAPSTNKAASAEGSSTLPPSLLAQAFATGQGGSAYVAGSTSERMDALDATSPNNLGKGLQAAGVETHAALQNVTTQLELQGPAGGHEARGGRQAGSGPEAQSSTQDAIGPNAQISTRGQQPRNFSRSIPFESAKAASASPNTEVSQDKDSKASSVNKAAPAEASSTLPPSQAAQAVTAGQEGFAPVTGSAPTWERIEVTSPSHLGKGLQAAGVETHAPLQNVTTQLEPQDSSSGPEARGGRQAGSGPEAQSSDKDAIGPNAQISTRGQQPRNFLRSVPLESAKAASASPNTTENSQDKVKETPAPPLNITVRTEDSSSPQASSLAQGVITGEEGSAPAKGSAPTWDRIEATSPGNLGKGLQAAGVETHAPLHQETTKLEPQDPSNAPEARTRQQAESSPESQSSPQDAIDPNVQISTAGPLSPDFSLSMPFELTKAVSTGRLDEPQNSNRIKNSQEGDPATSGNSNDADPGSPRTSLLQQPDQTKDTETESFVHDTKQADASPDKKGGEAAQDLTKMADGKGGLPKANADPALPPQLITEGRADAGRASPEAAGASPGRGQAGSASIFEGGQANAGTVVSSARFTQQAGNAEMQVRLRSEALGPIDVHTIVKGTDIGASIRAEARDTQVMLANELSQLERALNARSLRVERLDVLQGSVSGGRSNGTGPGNSYESPSEPRPSFSSYSAGQTYTSSPETPTVSEDWGLGPSTTRINLRV